MFLPTVSPHDPSLVLEHCDMTGSYISFDAGRSWRMFNLRGTVSAFAFDPKDPRAIYAGNHALWQSTDTGKTWRMVLPDPARNTVEHLRDDHSAPMLTTADPAYQGPSRVRFIAVDPADSKRIYVLFGNAWLVVSRDRGSTWSRVRQFSGEAMQAMYFDSVLRLVSPNTVSRP